MPTNLYLYMYMSELYLPINGQLLLSEEVDYEFICHINSISVWV